MTNYEKVNPKQSFPKMEEEILKFWQEEKIFEESIENRADSKEFNFYDGPPFATGTPHYGHILAGTIKDVIPRYQTMKGFRVDRKFGWDCHGLPIENIVEKKLKISGKDDIEQKVGVYNFNEECRKNVFTYAEEWKTTVSRMGRWVDMENDYKTMDTNFMESVWWVYKSIYDKGLIYEGHRVVPYCPRCSTPLSNFEVNQGYKNKQDKAATVKFKVTGTENKYILAWTTTPWTLVANLGLAVGDDLEYVELLDNSTKETYILAKDRIGSYYKNTEEYSIMREYKGSCLVGIKYEPVFSDFETLNNSDSMPLGMELEENTYSVVSGHHVTTESGTGIVHIAPAYGEDDAQIGKEQKLGFVNHIADNGNTEHLLENNGVQVFEFNEIALNQLKESKQVVQINTIDHSYPHCWRCESPLIYRAISAWYVAVEKIRENMVKNNQEINWVPDAIKNGRFGKWLEGARDWNISRNRYWGSAIPVWQNEDKSEEVCVGSIEELYKGNKDFGQITKKDNKYFYTNTNKEVDIHKHFVDEILIKNPKAIKSKNILGIHGFKRTNKVIDFFELSKKNLELDGITFDYPTFDEGENTYYKVWEEKLNSLELSKYDTWLCHSLGCRVSMEYIIENKLKLKRLILVAPGLESKNENVNNFYNELKNDFSKINNFVDELIIISDKDDTVHRQDGIKELVKITGANHIQTTGNGHFNIKESNLIEGITKFGTPLKRIPEVLDCWFESGSMPYASKHYPFEKGEEFKFPADFIAEGLDQTRGWFYTLLILGTGLFDQAPMKNVIVNGIVLAEDGHKMSKSKQNYPAPEIVFDKYGADAMRFYLMNSPVVEAQDFRFVESGVEEVVKKVILPLWNTYYFFTTYANIDNFKANGSATRNNNLDKWLISELNNLTKEVSTGFDEYKLNDATKPIVKFMDNLTNWYIRRSRKRFWKSENDGDKLEAYETLYFTLVELTKIIAPFMPFVSEYIYKNLTGEKSVHLTDFPKFDEALINEELNSDTDKVQKIITLGLAARANAKRRVRQPLKNIQITEELNEYYNDIIKEELNVKEVLPFEVMPEKICKPNGRAIGPKFGKDVKFIMSEAKNGNFSQLENGNVKVGEFELKQGDFELEYEDLSGLHEYDGESDVRLESGFGTVIGIETNITKELELEGYARDIVRQIQEARKEAGYEVDDRIKVSIQGIDEILENFGKYIEKETLSTIDNKIKSSDLEKIFEIGEKKVTILLQK